jgi:hypothetical protein
VNEDTTPALIELEDGLVVDEKTGEIVEGNQDDVVQKMTRLALEADEQRKEWEKTARLYKQVLKRLDVDDVTTPAGRAVRRGGYLKYTANRELWDASFLVQDLTYEERADIALECFATLDRHKLEARFEDGRISSRVLDDLVQAKPVAEWIEVNPIKKEAPKLKKRGAS